MASRPIQSSDVGDIDVRGWTEGDDPGLRLLMRAQMRIDPGWPPDYARQGDLAEWLGAPATLGRWVAVDAVGSPIGHVGLGHVTTGLTGDMQQVALGCERDRLAEICRMVVNPRLRRNGLSGRLTRKALRAAIEAGLVPVASVLCNRGSWLTMLLESGWRDVGRTRSVLCDDYLVALIPPQRYVDAALVARDSSA